MKEAWKQSDAVGSGNSGQNTNEGGQAGVVRK